MKNIINYILILSTFLLSSCALEQNNLSPVNQSFSDAKIPLNLEESYDYSIKENLNAAEISNIIADFPQFNHKGINQEIVNLKYHLQNYLYALEAYNTEGKKRYLEGIEKSYKKIQKLRKHLSEDEDQILNRSLVRIKTNISAIESLNLTTSK